MQKTTNIPTGYQLSEENKEKVCLIIDIIKAEKVCGIKPLTAQRFDELYDQSIESLNMSYVIITGYARAALSVGHNRNHYLDIRRGIQRANTGDLDCD